MFTVKRFILLIFSAVLTAIFALSIFTGSGHSFVAAASAVSLFSLDQKNGTVKKAKQDITGKLELKGNVDKVTYEVYAQTDNGELSFKGDAAVSGDTFTISSLKLKPQNNTIVVTAHTTDGKENKQTININYDAGTIKDVPLKNVAKVSGGSNMKYVVNNLLVYFDEGTDDAKRQEIIDTVNGKCVGSSNGINMWQVEVKPDSYAGLKKTAEKLKALDGVFDADCNLAQAAATMETVPSDPWYSNSSPAWTELNPNGGNWSVEAIQAMSAWDYKYFFKNIKVGIVDAGVQNDHEDLAGKISFPDAVSAGENDPTDNHGTHVAGIIGAIPNNSKGVTGILWNTTMYAYNWDTLVGTDAHLFAGLSKTVQAGAKVVNFSLGLANDISGYGPPATNSYVISYANQSKNVMVPLLNTGYEFVVVQSAGNGQGGYSQDAVYNGYFCSVTTTNLTGISTEMINKINERIIIVGSAGRTGILTFMQAQTSNAGSQVDICAPGVSIWSCYAGNNYNYMSGTSMAAPEVTGVTALAWSVNPTLTGAQVRSLVLNNTAYTVADSKSSYHPLVNTYNMVSAKLAVEAAIATIPPDYSAVNTAVTAANALNSALYTPASWANLTSSLNAVDYGLESKFQVQINAMAVDINTAVANLVLKTVSYTVEYRLNSESGSKLAANKAGTGQVTKTVTEAAISVSGYSPMSASKNLILGFDNNLIVFVYMTRPQYGVVLNTYKELNGLLVPVTAAAQGDVITVTVSPSTNFYCAASKFVVMYDKNFYTLVGTGTPAFILNSENSYYHNTVTSFTGTTASPAGAWPATFTGGESSIYNYATAYFATGIDSLNGGYPTIMSDGQWLFSFKLKVNTGATGSGRIFMDHRWTRTNTNSGGAQFFSACSNAAAPSSTGNRDMDFNPNLTQADRSVSIAVPLTVSFSLNGGTGTLPNPQIGVSGIPLTLPVQGDIARQYFNFLGWAETPDATLPLASFNFPASDMVLYAVWSNVPPLLNCPAGATVDDNNFIYGIEPGTAKTAFTVSGDYRLQFTPNNDIVGTGTVISLYRNGSPAVLNEFVVVIYGDVNGDGSIDSIDAGTAVDFENYLILWNVDTHSAFLKAGDVNSDGKIDSMDAGMMVDAENYVTQIDQHYRTGSV